MEQSGRQERFSGKRLQETCRFLFQLDRTARMVERDDLPEGRSKFFSGKSIRLVNESRIGGPAEGDLPDREVFLESRSQEFDALHGRGTALRSPVALYCNCAASTMIACAQVRSKRRDWLASSAAISGNGSAPRTGRLSKRRATLRMTPYRKARKPGTRPVPAMSSTPH